MEPATGWTTPMGAGSTATCAGLGSWTWARPLGCPCCGAGTPEAEFWRLSFRQIGEPAVDAGLLARRDLDRLLALLDEPAFIWMEMTLMAVWGRRPGG